MIIEEQTDKMVTHLNEAPPFAHRDGSSTPPLHDLHIDTHAAHVSNDTYHLQDGSTLLERVSSETLTKETFIVRPEDGQTDSLWMNVTRTISTDHLHAHQPWHHAQEGGEHGSTVPMAATGDADDTQSIFLDIAGYKLRDGDESDESDSPRDGENAKNAKNDEKSEKGMETLHDTATAKWEEAVREQRDSNTTIQVPEGATYRIQLSTCGFSSLGHDAEANARVFAQHQVSFSTFVQTPNILNDKQLVIKHNDQYYAAAGGKTPGPLFTTLLVFREPALMMHHQPTDATTSPIVVDKTKDDDASTHQNDTAATTTYRLGRGWSQWFRRSSVKGVDEHVVADHEDGDHHHHHHTATYTTTTTATTVGMQQHAPPSNLDAPSDLANTAELVANNEPKAEEEPLAPSVAVFSSRRHFVKTLRLTSDQLKSLPLKKGVNTISYSVTSAYQGTATCSAKIFLWDSSVKVIISDIDGTITKSDALGHVFTMIGKDWTHLGVAKLYTDIHHNGYQFLYLTSRAIGQADYTRDYLKRVTQNDYQLPDGPVLMSPDRLFTSFHREVIVRKPEVFKMACLKDIQRLFFSSHAAKEPFYAGFGNRVTDGISYRSVGVPASRIFTIDPYGQLRLELLHGFQSSYVDLHAIIDQMFPPLANDNEIEDQTFNDWNFWKTPLPEIDIELPVPEPLSPSSSIFATGMPSPTSPTLSTASLRSTSPPPRLPSPLPVSPKTKPKPIVPDISNLPRDAVIDTTPSLPPQQRQEKQSLLRRLTSRTSLLSTSPPPATSSAPATPPSSFLSSPSSPAPSSYSLSTPMARASSQLRSPLLATSSSSSMPIKDDKGTKTLDFELLDDDAFDATLDALEDEIDMDSIPFI
ncbi:Lipin/Ned1/Smp2-domain-containing protein [Gongronella butleri]|nr:Lipin/Ned1/Smp2-domain-containing protein [Gongronella butleri]